MPQWETPAAKVPLDELAQVALRLPLDVLGYIMQFGVPADPESLVRHITERFRERGGLIPSPESIRRELATLLKQLHRPPYPESEYLSDAQFREMVGVTAHTTARWRRERVGPSWTRAGRRILYRRSDVEAWLKSRAVEHTAAGAA